MIHIAIATIATADAERAVAALRALPAGVVAEIRLDSFWHEPPEPEPAAELLLSLMAAARPMIATLRPARDGGAWNGPEDVRVGLLVAAARAGFWAIDIEGDAPGVVAAVREAKAAGAQIVASRHLDAAPGCEDGEARLLQLLDVGGDLQKLAFRTRRFGEELRAFELARLHHPARGALVPMGTGGAPLRAALAVAGNAATYGHAEGLPPSAPGQPGLAQALHLWRHWDVSPEELGAARPWLAVVGNPVLHSLSPRMYNASLRRHGRLERMAALTVPPDPGALFLLAAVAQRIGLVGASVTAPLKIDAARFAKGDPIVTACGAANCLRWTGEAVEATNTDAIALRRLLAPHAGADATATVLGAGGLARAALWALRDLRIAATVTARDPVKGAAVAHRFGANFVPWPQREAARASILLQCTPSRDLDLAAPAQVRAARVVVEATYAEHPTPLEDAATEAGATLVGGRRLLLEQGLDAYRFWIGREPDRAAMEAAL